MFEFSFNLFVSVFLLLGCLWAAVKYVLAEDVVYIHDGKKRHSWKSIKILNRSCFCSVCEIMLSSNGVFCECCGVCSDNGCMKKADSSIKCKERRLRSAEEAKVSKHLWVHGNLPLNSECFICGEDIDHQSEPGLFGKRCCWCQRTVHDPCFSQIVAGECDFGEFRDMIVPPKSILAARTKGAPKLHLTGVVPPEWPNWKPLIVVANAKSGSSESSGVISQLRSILHPLQVIELGSHGPHEALQWAIYTAPKSCRILVAGGDGTVDWVLNTILSMKIEPHPEVCIVPLGTGNDLSRVLGWGSEGPDEFDPVAYLRKIQKAEPLQIDRWLAEINVHHHYRFHLPGIHRRNIFVYNYFSIGVDALVTLNFHKARESSFYLFSSRIVNKLLYLCFGTHQVVQQDCIGLENNIELYLDDVKIELPELQSVVVLNIDSWGAGVKLWEMSKDSKEIQSISDGILEVFGVVSSFHIAQLQVGLSKPVRLGQAKNVKIKMNATLPVQADGEPWMQSPCDISITHHGQATMLKSSS